MSYTVLPLKNGLSNIKDIFCDGLFAGLKEKKKRMSAFIYSKHPLEIEALLTNNRFKAAPLRHFLSYPPNFTTNFILLNSKNANAMTGEKGIADVQELLDFAKEHFKAQGIWLNNPIMSSTGVIGERLPKDKLKQVIANFDLSVNNSDACAKAIMTTDRFKKEIAFEVQLKSGTFRIAGIAKGAGMIHPNMANASLATMLCFIVTDANIPKTDMKELLVTSNCHHF